MERDACQGVEESHDNGLLCVERRDEGRAEQLVSLKDSWIRADLSSWRYAYARVPVHVGLSERGDTYLTGIWN